MNPRVSIIIPTHNQASFIRDAVESALKQSYVDIEVVISDDFSTDNTYEALQTFLSDDRVKYFKNTKNLGRVKNYRNTLIECASGDWVVNLDGDDYFTDNEFIQRAMVQINSVDNNSVVGYLTNRHINLDRLYSNIILDKLNNRALVVDGLEYFKHYYQIGGFRHLSFLYQRERAIDIGFYEYDYLASDFISFMKLLMHGNIILSNYEIGVWRKHENNASQKFLYKKFEENILVTEVIAEYSSFFLEDHIIQTWKLDAFKNNKEILVMDLIHESRGLKQLLLILLNFKLRKVYFILLAKFLLRKKFV